jgi:hypothetical protein
MFSEREMNKNLLQAILTIFLQHIWGAWPGGITCRKELGAALAPFELIS